MPSLIWAEILLRWQLIHTKQPMNILLIVNFEKNVWEDVK